MAIPRPKPRQCHIRSIMGKKAALPPVTISSWVDEMLSSLGYANPGSRGANDADFRFNGTALCERFARGVSLFPAL
jgi:hypothetical protein